MRCSLSQAEITAPYPKAKGVRKKNRVRRLCEISPPWRVFQIYQDVSMSGVYGETCPSRLDALATRSFLHGSRIDRCRAEWHAYPDRSFAVVRVQRLLNVLR